METPIRQKRTEASLTLREIARSLGGGFSTAKLSLAERGLLKISAQDEAVVLEAIRRLGPLSQSRRRIVEIARNIDFAPFMADVRETRSNTAHA